jgi:hypothetical protein
LLGRRRTLLAMPYVCLDNRPHEAPQVRGSGAVSHCGVGFPAPADLHVLKRPEELRGERAASVLARSRHCRFKAKSGLHRNQHLVQSARQLQLDGFLTLRALAVQKEVRSKVREHRHEQRQQNGCSRWGFDDIQNPQ